jgi:hypothetical protein
MDDQATEVTAGSLIMGLGKPPDLIAIEAKRVKAKEAFDVFVEKFEYTQFRAFWPKPSAMMVRRASIIAIAAAAEEEKEKEKDEEDVPKEDAEGADDDDDDDDGGIEFHPSISTLGDDSVIKGMKGNGIIPPKERKQSVKPQQQRKGSVVTQATIDTLSPPPSHYNGVTSFNRRVIKLDFNTQNLTGPLPGSIGASVFPITTGVPPDGTEVKMLGKLKMLILFKNEFIGLIPSTYGDFDVLQHLDLSHNLLDGEIPETIFGIKTLKALHLECNIQLCGTIPPSIGQLINLTVFSAHYNRIEGHLPPEIEGCVKLGDLSLHHNRMSGEIPIELGSLPKLQFLHLSNNHFVVPNSSMVTEIGKQFDSIDSNPNFQIMPQTEPGDSEDEDDDWTQEEEDESVMTLDTPL